MGRDLRLVDGEFIDPAAHGVERSSHMVLGAAFVTEQGRMAHQIAQQRDGFVAQGGDGGGELGLVERAVEGIGHDVSPAALRRARSEEHTSELQSLMRHSYAVFCLKKNKATINTQTTHMKSSD